MAKPQKTDGKLSGTPLRAGSRSEGRQNEASDFPGTKIITVLEGQTRARRRASGPRTAIGKQRSSLNAHKYGIFSKRVLLADESARDFGRLLQGLHEDLQPDGTLEIVLVEKLATILWRKQRILRAEAAEIEEAVQYSVHDTVMPLLAEKWDCARAGETAGGMLKHCHNPNVLREVVTMLELTRYRIELVGFSKDPWLLRRIYGLDHDDSAPFGTPFQMYLHMRDEAADHAKGNPNAESEEDLKKKMLLVLDEEIKRVEALAENALRVTIERNEFRKTAALVPPLAVSERLLRYESHLSREFDRTLSQLERLQRIRRGQPVLPPIDVRLSR
jgi:hypothetical protein